MCFYIALTLNKGREQNAIFKIHLFQVGFFPVITALYNNVEDKFCMVELVFLETSGSVPISSLFNSLSYSSLLIAFSL